MQSSVHLCPDKIVVNVTFANLWLYNSYNRGKLFIAKINVSQFLVKKRFRALKELICVMLSFQISKLQYTKQYKLVSGQNCERRYIGKIFAL